MLNAAANWNTALGAACFLTCAAATNDYDARPTPPSHVHALLVLVHLARESCIRSSRTLEEFLLAAKTMRPAGSRGRAGSRAWLASLRFADRASQLTIADYLHSHDVLVARRETIEDELSKLAVDSPCAVAIGRLRCLRGIDTLSALGLCAEIGEWDRFDHPDQLSAYLGIVPCEHTTSSQRRQGSITKAGSTHARRLLIEASYHYRRHPGVSEPLERRQRDQPPEIINIAWRAQRRLNARWRQLKDARKKPNGIVAVAIARELAGFCWEIATWSGSHPDPVPPASMPAGDPLTQARSVPPKHDLAMT